MWGPPEDEPEYELYRSRPAIVMLFSLSVMSLGDGTQHGSEPHNMKESSWGLPRKENVVPSFPAFEY